jgi:hypothetical protein
MSLNLCHYLTDTHELSSGQAQTTLDLYLAIENQAAPRRFLLTSLFYHEMKDFERYEFESERAVLSGAYPSRREFANQLDQFKDFLLQPRLSDQMHPTFVGAKSFPIGLAVWEDRYANLHNALHSRTRMSWEDDHESTVPSFLAEEIMFPMRSESSSTNLGRWQRFESFWKASDSLSAEK